MQADWQALQPMHFETSMSFATSAIASERTLGAAEIEAERRVTSSDWSAMVRLLSGHALRSLLDVHEERLELRGLGVGVADERRQGVGEVARLREPVEAPVERDADGVDLLARDLQRLDPLRDDRLRDDLAALRADDDPVAAPDPLLRREDLVELDERLRLEDRRDARVLRPEVEVLDHAVRRGGV